MEHRSHQEIWIHSTLKNSRDKINSEFRIFHKEKPKEKINDKTKNKQAFHTLRLQVGDNITFQSQKIVSRAKRAFPVTHRSVCEKVESWTQNNQ